MALGKNMNLMTELNDQQESASLMELVVEETAPTVSKEPSLKIALVQSKTDKNKIILELDGRLTIENVELIKDKVELATIQYEKVELNLVRVLSIDLSVVQLFYYLKWEATNDGLEFEITHQMSSESLALIKKCGLEGFEPKSVKNL